MSSYTCRNTACNSLQKWDIGNHVRTILLADADIAAQVGQHVYPIVAPENTDGDFIVYRRESYSKSSTKMGVYDDVCIVAVTAISDSYDDSVELASAIDNALFGTHTLTADGETVQFECSLDDSTETYDENKYIQTLIIRIK